MLRRFGMFAIPLVVLGIAIFVAGYLRATKPVVAPAPPTERVWTVAAVSAVREDIRPEIRLFGEIVSGRTINLRPQISGKIIQGSPNLVEGGIVRKGELIVQIDPFDYIATVGQRKAELSEARGRLRELQAGLDGAKQLLQEDDKQLELHRRDTERRIKLRGSGAGSVKSADDARLAFSEAKQRQIDRKKEIKRLSAAISQQIAAIERLTVTLSLAERDLSKTKVLSPADGFVSSVETAEGKWLNIGDNVASLIDSNRLEARFHISRKQFRRLMSAGGFRDRPARIIWRGRAEEIPYSAYIDRVASEVDAKTGGVHLYAKVETGGVETILRPGAFVEVYIKDRLYKEVYRIPDNAIYVENIVYVIKNNRLEARKVIIQGRVGSDILVSGPIKTREMIVITRLPEATSGLKVAIQ